MDACPSSVVRELVVWIAVEPALGDLRRGDDGVTGGARVLGRVAIRRAVAAERDAAFLARSQVHPSRADGDAFAADALVRLLDRVDGGDVRARHFEGSYSARTLWTNATEIEPSPTADATRLTLPCLTSPTAKTR